MCKMMYVIYTNTKIVLFDTYRIIGNSKVLKISLEDSFADFPIKTSCPNINLLEVYGDTISI